MPRDLEQMFYKVMAEGVGKNNAQMNYLVPFRKINFTIRSFRRVEKGTSVVFGKVIEISKELFTNDHKRKRYQNTDLATSTIMQKLPG